MSYILPSQTIDVLRSFSDLIIGLVGIDCTLYIPTNLTALEPNDAYTSPDDITYKQYLSQKVWINWAESNMHKLRKLGIYAEDESPILARFKNTPEVIIHSYIEVPTEFIPDMYSSITDKFEVADVLLSKTFDSEIYRWYRLVPLRRKT